MAPAGRPPDCSVCTTEKAAGVLKKARQREDKGQGLVFHSCLLKALAGGVAEVREVALIVDELNPRGKDQDIFPTGGHVGKGRTFVRTQEAHVSEKLLDKLDFVSVRLLRRSDGLIEPDMTSHLRLRLSFVSWLML